MYDSHECKTRTRRPLETQTRERREDAIVLHAMRPSGRRGPVRFKRLSGTGCYVSRHGAVYNTRAKKLIKPYVSAAGYSHVTLQAATCKLHRLVYGVWRGSWSQVVHHVDGDKRNNSLSNLEGLSFGEHSKRHGAWSKRTPYETVDESDLPADTTVFSSYKNHSSRNLLKSDSREEFYRRKGVRNPSYIRPVRTMYGTREAPYVRSRSTKRTLVEVPLKALGWGK